MARECKLVKPGRSRWDALFDILRCWVIAWIAAPVLVSISLVNANIIDEHLAREDEVLEILRLETR